MPWLANAASARDQSNLVWLPFEENLTGLLGDLEPGDFLILDVKTWVESSAEFSLGRYLQFLCTRVDGQRILVAEASGAGVQPSQVRHSDSTARLLTAAGWVLQPDSPNHRRVYEWPEGIGQVVADSTHILREVWPVSHPDLVRFRFDERAPTIASPGGPDVGRATDPAEAARIFEATSPGELIDVVERWLNPATTPEVIETQQRGFGMLGVVFPSGAVTVSADPDARSLRMTIFVGELAAMGLTEGDTDRWDQILDAEVISARALIGQGELYLGCRAVLPALVKENLLGVLLGLVADANHLRERLTSGQARTAGSQDPAP